jgi:hypothetical protein
MGSPLSGRRDGKPLVEDSLTLDLVWLMRLGPIHHGQAGSGNIHWTADGNPAGSMQFRLDLRKTERARLTLHGFAVQNGRRKSVSQEITLMALPQHFGGYRWWMLCPVTGERVRTLHLPSGGDRFAGRKAWKLAYRSERLDRFDRPFEKLFRMQRRLGRAEGLGAGLPRSKGMWRRTYARHLARFEVLEFGCVEKIAAVIERV